MRLQRTRRLRPGGSVSDPEGSDISHVKPAGPSATAALAANLLGALKYVVGKNPGFAAGKIWWAIQLLITLPQHHQVLRVLSHEQSARLARKYPAVAFKCLGNYVALGLPLRVRRGIFLSHFQFLQRTYAVDFLDTLEQSPPLLWQRLVDGRRLELRLELTGFLGGEGDLRLFLCLDGELVYRLAFVFSAGQHLGVVDKAVVVVSAVQGTPRPDLVKVATRLCCDIQPGHILMAALAGIAGAAHLSTMVGVDESRQLFRRNLRFSYGEFFGLYGTEIPGQGLYRIPLPFIEKPTSEIRPSHRRRNRHKRQFRAAVRAEVTDAIRPYLLATRR